MQVFIPLLQHQVLCLFFFVKRINVNYYEKGIKFLLLTEGKEKNDEHIK